MPTQSWTAPFSGDLNPPIGTFAGELSHSYNLVFRRVSRFHSRRAQITGAKSPWRLNFYGGALFLYFLSTEHFHVTRLAPRSFEVVSRFSENLYPPVLLSCVNVCRVSTST